MIDSFKLIIVLITFFLLTIWFLKRKKKNQTETFVPIMRESVLSNGSYQEFYSVGNQRFDNLDNAKNYARELKNGTR